MRNSDDPAPPDTGVEASDAFARTSDPLNATDQQTDQAPISEDPGAVIGRFRLLEKIGEGGFGVVYVAEQKTPVKRRVALKIIKLGMDTRSVVARFEAERQALAMMDHPNIAKVFDAGATDSGRPYFVMELVRGIPITDYCDQNNLPPVQRLNLFIDVCHAIQHAHQKGVIHRDIKPSNILVALHDGMPVPKVIDFGIAKATQGDLTDKTVYTQFQQFVGTPAYMSPEQAEMSALDVDTRSDIYSLGVLLYELLTGTTPFDAKELMKVGMDQLRRTIRDAEPARPSSRISGMVGEASTTTAKRRGMEPHRLVALLRGDLDWVVMKCLEKDRTRRYETANGLAVDIQRHLKNETVAARPPSSAYRLQKLVRRNKLVFAAGGTVAAALVLGLVACLILYVKENEAYKHALIARHEADAARANEAGLRWQAQADELAARQRAYASDMNVAMQALERHNLGRAIELLERQQRGPGQQELRGWEWRYLWQQTRSDALFTLCQEPSEVSSLAVSPDGQLLALGLNRGPGVSVWDLRTRREVTRLATNEGLSSVAFSPTDPLLAFAGSDGSSQRHTLHLWHTTTRQMTAELPLEGTCAGLAFAQDGQRLLTCTRGEQTGRFTIWHMPDGAKLDSYPSHFYGINLVRNFAATSDLRLAACSAAEGHVRVVDLRDGKELWSVPVTKNIAATAAFSPDGHTLATAGLFDRDILLWDAASGQKIGSPLQGHGAWVASLKFWPDGKKLASGSGDQTIRVWDLSSGTVADELRGHRQEVWQLALLPDNKTLVSGAKDGTVCFWDTSHAHPHQPGITLPAQNVFDWHFAPDGKSILTLDEHGGLTQWSGDHFEHRATLLEAGPDFSSAAFSADGRFLAVAWDDGKLLVWNTSQGVMVQQLTMHLAKPRLQSLFSGGQKLIVSSQTEHLLQEWDVGSCSMTQSWAAPAPMQLAVVTPDEQSCIALGFGHDSIVRNLADQRETTVSLDAPEADVAVFSPDGKLFAVASSMGFARVWDCASWQPLKTIGNFLNGVHGVNVSPDGKRLMVAGHDAEAVRLCDTETWQDLITLDGPAGRASPAFSPDGNTLVWGSRNALVAWRAPSWDEIRAEEGQQQTDHPRP